MTIKQDYLDIAKLLLNYKADLFIKDNYSATAIEIA
jgi:ankyrin repeat protein